MSVYSKVPIYKPGRNVFNLSHGFKGSLNIGELVPIGRPIECVPGDTMVTGNITEVELNPIVTNFKGELYFETWQFFVSLDMLYLSSDSGKFTEILASMQNPQSILSLPYDNITTTGTRNAYTYLTGFADNSNPNGDLHIVSYLFRTYPKIINEWFRDENLESEYSLPAVYSGFTSQFYHINYKKDRFTSAFLSTQKGNPITFNLGQNAKIKYVGKEPLGPGSYSYNKPSFSGSISPSSALFNAKAYVDPLDPNTNNPVLNIENATDSEMEFTNERMKHYIVSNYVADMTSLPALTINDLRLYNKLQKWLERCQLCGTRIKEYLLANYGVTPNDETLQRPVLIGHTKVPVVVNDFVANIKNTNDNTQTYQNFQGSKGGYASASSSFKYGKWFCKEFGWLITLGALRPKAVYCQGIHKSITKDSVIDYFNPIFEHLGQQPIYNKELFVSHSNVDNEIFGYQDIYNEMRHMEDFLAPDVTGAGYQTKNIFREFATTPTLSRSFIEVKSTEYDYLFAIPSTTAPQAFFNSTNIIKAVRPITKRSIPSL